MVDFDSTKKEEPFTSTSITLFQRDAAPCGKLFRKAQSRAVQTISVVPRALLAGVGPLVPQNGALLAEAHWAHGASVGLLPGVGPLVPRNVALDGKPASKSTPQYPCRESRSIT